MVQAITSIIDSLHSTLTADPYVRKYLESEKCVYKGFPGSSLFASRNSIAIEPGDFAPITQNSIRKTEQSAVLYSMKFLVHVGYTENHREKSFEEFCKFISYVANAIDNSPNIETNDFVKNKLPPEFSYSLGEDNKILYHFVTITLEYQGVIRVGQL